MSSNSIPFSFVWSYICLCLYAHKCRGTVPHFDFSLANHYGNICKSLWHLGKLKFLFRRHLWRGVISIVQMGSWEIKNMISKVYNNFQSTLWSIEGWCFSEYSELYIECSEIPRWKKDNVYSYNHYYILMQTCKSHLIFSWKFSCLLLFSEDLCGYKFSNLLSVFLNFHIPEQLKMKLSRETFLYSLGCFCFIGTTQISCSL